MLRKDMKKHPVTFLLLRFSIASVFLYAAIASLFEPQNWIGYFPLFLRHILPERILLLGFSLYEFLLTVWLLWGKYIFYAACIAAVTLLAIIGSNIGALDIVFRDIAIFFAALALITYCKGL
jgi:uncharacterized membrane protein YphA (DoxX/SURF4 family)